MGVGDKGEEGNATSAGLMVTRWALGLGERSGWISSGLDEELVSTFGFNSTALIFLRCGKATLLER